MRVAIERLRAREEMLRQQIESSSRRRLELLATDLTAAGSTELEAIERKLSADEAALVRVLADCELEEKAQAADRDVALALARREVWTTYLALGDSIRALTSDGAPNEIDPADLLDLYCKHASFCADLLRVLPDDRTLQHDNARLGQQIGNLRRSLRMPPGGFPITDRPWKALIARAYPDGPPRTEEFHEVYARTREPETPAYTDVD